ncbi:hypothetical protein KEM60_00109 [Austwickia sp. TVS 96-490-7B]|uniref:alpha/beta hydrolase n=1 Tax=Austwickia sp. TVS 96-490-7B TaxID=2830843 RepID=UPI001C58298D|nr:alpha/beta hydrolase [Austwickia sp. TVS 96-490-7B]MBW3083927.1 hypothetical protein [Austwickia sp. TVS 96-490-7B]
MRAVTAVLAASAIIIPTLPSPAGAAGPAPSGPQNGSGTPTKTLDISAVKTPTLEWKTCAEKQLRDLKCATVLLPLDYSKPDGDKIEVHVAKKAATGKKKGVVFTNPGGPGQLASRQLTNLASIMGNRVTEQYDVIGVDPRGVHVTTRTRCWSDQPAPPGKDRHFPITAEQTREQHRFNVFYRDACAKTSRPIIDHISSAQVARDMEMIRRALGEKTINYYGISYGTFLGATYAALFPNRVGRMVNDGVLDPVAWSTGHGKDGETQPVTARYGPAEESAKTLQAAFAECKKAGPNACPHSTTVEKEWGEVLDRLRKGPFVKDGETLTFDGWIRKAALLMYDTRGYRNLMILTHQTWEAMAKQPAPPQAPSSTTTPTATSTAPTAPPAAPTTTTRSTRAATAPAAPSAVSAPPAVRGDEQQSLVGPLLGIPAADTPIRPVVPPTGRPSWSEVPGLLAVLCSDTKNPNDPKVWDAYSTPDALRKNPFQAYWAWGTSICANWPGRDRNVYQGPFDTKLANPMLVIGNTHDPATPLRNAQALAKLSPGARLLTVDVFGHVAGNKNRCASKAIETYLADGKLPAQGATCKPDQPLFS